MFTYQFDTSPQVFTRKGQVADLVHKEDCGVHELQFSNSVLDGNLKTCRVSDGLTFLILNFQIHREIEVVVKSRHKSASHMLMLFNAGSSVDLREYSENNLFEADQSSLLVSLPGEVSAMVLTFKSGVRYRIVLIECDFKLLSEEKLCMGGLLPESLKMRSKSTEKSRFRHSLLTKSMMELVYKCETLGGEGISRRIALEAFSKELIALGLDSLTTSGKDKKTMDIGMSASESDAVFKAADILRKEFVHPPLQRNLSKRVGLNLNKLSLCFQEVYGLTINKFVLNLKLEKAKSLLSSENKPTVGEVAAEIGFNNTSYFIRKFRAAYGQTPGEFV